MQKNKLVQLLNTLTAEEMRQLDKFVRSPVHNKHEAVIQLFQYLRKSLADEAKLQKEKVFNALFPGQPFDMQQVHYVNSYLMKVVEEFLAWQSWRQNEASFYLHLLRSLRRRRLDYLFSITLEKARKQQEVQPLRDARFLLDDYQFRLEEYTLTTRQEKNPSTTIQAMIAAQDLAFFAEKLKNGCSLLAHQAMSKAVYEPGLLEPVLTYLANRPDLLQIPAIGIYYLAYLALSKLEDDESFYRLKAMLVQHGHLFPQDELSDIHIAAINYCIRCLNNGRQAFMRELFEIYQSGLETKVFFDKGIFSPRTYSNIVMAGLKLGEYNWVEQFIERYKDALPEKQREGFYNYNLARFFYEKKNYQQAMRLLLQMEYGIVQITCLGKILLAKMYFEQEEFETLGSLLQSFKVFLRRKKMLGYHQESYLSFINFLGRLLQNPSRNNLREEIENASIVAEKDWLLEQVK